MPRTKNEYTAVATAKMRFAEILTSYGRCDDTEQAARVVNLLEMEGVSIEIKPRLKSVVITVPIPEPAPEPKLGKFAPVPVADDYEPQLGEDDVDLG